MHLLWLCEMWRPASLAKYVFVFISALTGKLPLQTQLVFFKTMKADKIIICSKKWQKYCIVQWWFLYYKRKAAQNLACLGTSSNDSSSAGLPQWTYTAVWHCSLNFIWISAKLPDMLLVPSKQKPWGCSMYKLRRIKMCPMQGKSFCPLGTVKPRKTFATNRLLSTHCKETREQLRHSYVSDSIYNTNLKGLLFPSAYWKPFSQALHQTKRVCIWHKVNPSFSLKWLFDFFFSLNLLAWKVWV